MSANIVLSLSATKLEVAPGESVEATIIVRNQSQVIDQFGIRIQGLDPSWWTLSTSSVSLFPGDQGEAKLTIHPPREAEARAGSYSFQVRAVSQANPEEMTEEEAYLILRGFLVWDVEMSPTKVAGASGTYQITATNSGNTEITLVFEGKDPEEALDYTFRHDKVTVPAGESALVTLKVSPKQGQKEKLYSFQVVVRPAGAKVPSKETRTIDGQLEYRRRHFPWKWILLGLAIIAIAILVWKFVPPLLNPPDPVINSFTAEPESITVGDSAILSWDVSGATEVTIDQEIGAVTPLTTGTCTVSPSATTTYTLTASNAAGSTTDTVQLTVSLPPLPVINSFTASPTSITEGDDSTLSWSVSSATEVTIDQGLGSVGLSGTRTVSPTTTTTYTLKASNEAGSSTDTAKVTVSAPSPSLPNLTITTGSPTVTPSTVAPEGAVIVSAFTVKNQGSADSGSFHIGMYLSTDSVITASDTLLNVISYGNLDPGAQQNVGERSLAIPIGTPSGDYYIGILVDRTNAVSESDETDNYAASQITVGPASDTTPPQLSITYSPESPTTEDNVTFTATASDAGGIDRIEILINYRPVKTCTDSPCTYTGGPYPEGTVYYGANAYDKAGNRAWTGYLSFAVGPASDTTAVPVINSLAAGEFHTVGLRSDGTVVAVGENVDGACDDVTGWTDIVQVAAGNAFTVGLKSDGTVVAVGSNRHGQCNVGDWTDIVQIAAGWRHTVGLKSNGTVVAVGSNLKGQCNVGSWFGITEVDAGGYHTVGLLADGTVVAVGENDDEECDVGSWTGIIQVAAGAHHTVGLKSYTVVAVGESGQCDVGSWFGITQVAAGAWHTVGLKSDGILVAVGSNGHGQCNVGSWTDIIRVAAGGHHTVGLKSDGTLVAVGNNQYGQCDVSGW